MGWLLVVLFILANLFNLRKYCIFYDSLAFYERKYFDFHYENKFNKYCFRNCSYLNFEVKLNFSDFSAEENIKRIMFTVYEHFS